MRTVQPIRDKKKIDIMKTLLREKDEKYYILFRVGINVGLRVSDILSLKVSDVRERSHVTIIEKKTGKARVFTVPFPLYQFIRCYCLDNGIAATDTIFPVTERSV